MAAPATCPPSENPDYIAPNYGSTKVYVGGTSGGAGGDDGARTAIASGLAGLAVGTVLGDMIGRNTAQGNNMQQSGDGNGRYDIVLDEGGYNITGDSGDDGFDIAGDSGD
eukprot:CAMPEP_0172555776 /NCGR_PEP_ID=MMETSP1067-20121228/60139_1 /TAXON_ID=265564 ORGANISM="Thalassiosira punctigera, Strain Tpunct2005C2" /NCGR_SAMPLE_ID=MMETSP1067 /ASSEMBLY_ACC=CAM_ASM_000444 /LENGTH=109 /DNA_ID=CAMNT_0013344369 /DNA_START=800 /DNA_END=1129 /DNA_ORIENTATION=-